MSREIKFRAWDVENEEWEYSDDFGLVAFFTAIATGILDSKTLTQYTGLKDCWGKEIYEGDILKHSSRKRDYFIPIVFEGGRFQHKSPGLPFLEHLWEGEVIGNIYENPELKGGEGNE